MNLKLSVIRLDGGTQAREELDQQIVARYAEHMQEGDKFPPIVVFHDGSNYWLADGFHRYFATKTIGGLEIDADVKEGTVRDAELYSYGANGNKRGLGWSSADIRKILTKMLMDEEWKKWSDVQIAKHVGVSSMTVGRVRHSLEEQGKIEPKKSSKYVNKHGGESTMKTGSITKSGNKPKGEAKKKDDKPKEKKIDPAFEDKLAELTDTITSISEENTLLKDKIALGQWDASEIEKIDAEELISDLRKQIKLLEMENQSLRESRDTYQNRNAELMRTVKALTNKLKKAGIE